MGKSRAAGSVRTFEDRITENISFKWVCAVIRYVFSLLWRSVKGAVSFTVALLAVPFVALFLAVRDDYENWSRRDRDRRGDDGDR